MTTDSKDTDNKETSPKRKRKSDKPSTSIAVMAIAYEDDGLTLEQIIKIAAKKARELKSVRHVIIGSILNQWTLFNIDPVLPLLWFYPVF